VSAKRFLTKSRFKVGIECPTKLYYLDKPEYANKNRENSFLEALAEGGFQVGALAQLYFPSGVEITAKDKNQAVSETKSLMSEDKSTIFEAAFQHDNLFLLADIIEKNKKSIRLIEVKAKSFDSASHESFFTKKGSIKSEWQDYLLDIAFQKYVIAKAHPELNVTAFMMFVDKSKAATVEGLNQNFLISKDESGRAKVTVKSGITKVDLGDEILKAINVDQEVEHLWAQTYFDKYSFAELVDSLSRSVETGERHPSKVGMHCKACEFKVSDGETVLKSGFENCWSDKVRKLEELKTRTPIFDIWNFRKADKLIGQGLLFADQLEEDDVSPSQKSSEVGLSQSQRQWLQVEKEKNKDKTPYLDIEGLNSEIRSWTYPLHFIDFETTMVALPFNAGRRPYEQMAFQFSHHVMQRDGSIVHQTQYINQEKGKFPNFDFLRALKSALEQDEGTILRFAAHENTVLCQIRQQLMNSDEPDQKKLISFIESVTTGPDEEWVGARNMVDLCELVKKFFYHPDTKGSNSIKKVLPAVLNESEYLKKKYSKPIYGAATGIASKNYSNYSWIVLDDEGKVKDPYKQLPPIFTDFELEEIESLLGSNTLADGGGAMTAYSRMQFSEMSKSESDRIVGALLKYCELDTLAMVMIVEYWMEKIKNQKRKAA
jgi:hypothetical protein